MSQYIDTTSDYNVHTGFWVRQSEGTVGGATLTLTRQAGAVLIAFLALYVGFAGSGLWNIVRYVLHRQFSTIGATDGVHHQRQAILRNAGSAHAAAWELFQVGVAWRGNRARRVARRVLPVIMLSAALSLLIAAAGLMSSRVILAANEVLLSGSTCGIEKSEGQTNVDFTSKDAAARSLRYDQFTQYLSYAWQCYRGRSRGEKCRTYQRSRLDYQKQSNAPCPFDEALCISNDSNLVLDTNFLHSEKHLGINGGPTFLIRQKRQCAPLVSNGFKMKLTDPDLGREVTRYSYKLAANSSGLEVDFDDENFTWQVYDAKVTLDRLGEMSSLGYKIGLVSERADEITDTNYVTRKGHPDAKLSFLFLEAANTLYKPKPIVDPWFAATTKWDGSDEDDPIYLPDEPASVLACATDTWVCNPLLPENQQCVSAYTGSSFTATLSKIWPSEIDRAGVQGALRFLAPLNGESNVFTVFDPDNFYAISGIANLLTRYSMSEIALQTEPIPANRWQDEMEYIFQASLASLQAYMVETATGNLLWDRSSSNYEACAPKEMCTAVCGRQMIKSPGFYSFSLLRVCLILSIGGILILAGYGIEYIAISVDWIRSLGRKESPAIAYAQAEWQVGSPLQLQRLAHEALGSGDWKGADDVVPVTQSGDVLGVLDVSDHKHPRLRHASTAGLATTGQTYDAEKRPAVAARAMTRDTDTWTERDSFLASESGKTTGAKTD